MHLSYISLVTMQQVARVTGGTSAGGEEWQTNYSMRKKKAPLPGWYAPRAGG